MFSMFIVSFIIGLQMLLSTNLSTSSLDLLFHTCMDWMIHLLCKIQLLVICHLFHNIQLLVISHLHLFYNTSFLSVIIHLHQVFVTEQSLLFFTIVSTHRIQFFSHLISITLFILTKITLLPEHACVILHYSQPCNVTLHMHASCNLPFI